MSPPRNLTQPGSRRHQANMEADSELNQYNAKPQNCQVLTRTITFPFKELQQTIFLRGESAASLENAFQLLRPFYAQGLPPDCKKNQATFCEPGFTRREPSPGGLSCPTSKCPDVAVCDLVFKPRGRLTLHLLSPLTVEFLRRMLRLWAG